MASYSALKKVVTWADSSVDLKDGWLVWWSVEMTARSALTKESLKVM